jgi:hypothetical protein
VTMVVPSSTWAQVSHGVWVWQDTGRGARLDEPVFLVHRGSQPPARADIRADRKSGT